MIQKAKKNGVKICYKSDLETLWPILLKNHKKFSTKPTHSKIEPSKTSRPLSRKHSNNNG